MDARREEPVPDRAASSAMSSIELSDADLQSILEFTSTLARKAGELILEASRYMSRCDVTVW